jgi:hypothetical protein
MLSLNGEVLSLLIAFHSHLFCANDSKTAISFKVCKIQIKIHAHLEGFERKAFTIWTFNHLLYSSISPDMYFVAFMT